MRVMGVCCLSPAHLQFGWCICCVPEAPAYLKAGYSGIICRAFPCCSRHATTAEQPTQPEKAGTLFPLYFIFPPFTEALLLSHVWEEEKLPG